MYRCCNCGNLFEEPKHVREDRGEFWGAPCSEDVTYSPCCGDDYEEVYRCNGCDEYFTEDQLNDEGLCKACKELDDDGDDVDYER
jgi:DNA-directed RNA polymerase subunit RPC12/RpoP